MIFSKECAVCKVSIRNKNPNPSYAIDNIIEQLLMQSKNKQEYMKWEQLKNINKKWAESKQ